MEIYFSSRPICQLVPLTAMPGPPANNRLSLPHLAHPPAGRLPADFGPPVNDPSSLSSLTPVAHSPVCSVFSHHQPGIACQSLPCVTSALPIRAFLPSPRQHCLLFCTRLDYHHCTFPVLASPRGNAQCTPHASGH
jgi:hypothetical protein